MPVNRIEVESSGGVQTYPYDNQSTAESDRSNPGLGTVSRPLTYLKYRDKVSWFAVFYRAVPEAVGVAGVKYAFSPSEIKWRRIFWMTLVALGLGVTGYQVVERTLYFKSDPKSVDISVDYVTQHRFPSVAICNYNVFRASATAHTEFGDFLESYTFEYPNMDYTPYRSMLESVNITDLYLRNGHRPRDSILAVRWNQDSSLSWANLTTRMTDWGVCFVFNDHENGLPDLTTFSSGRIHGLQIVLDVQQFDYFYDPKVTQAVGFQVLVYDRGSLPLVEGSGFAISPGRLTLTALEVTETTNLIPPHGQCGSRNLKYFDEYSHNACLQECETDFYLKQCGCRALHMQDIWVRNKFCDCPPDCFLRTYSPTVSQAEYPGTFWSSKFERLHGLNESYVRENICDLNVYFKEMSVQRITQKKDYNFFSLLCDIGGSLGLWLGGSILTFFEIVDLIFHSSYLYSKSKPNHGHRVAPSERK
ncbi:acid-sensing ion channel 1C-like [Diadema antillarum]|uniref:acid-sensing ion channel 1C-like n=1 Tax=Diadema antillarum TaxID=105358 RepID=UPI003A85E2B0